MSPLLQSGTTLYVCGGPSVSSPYIMEPDFGADSRIWDDILHQWDNYSKYLLRRYAWTGATSPRDLHLEPVSREGAYTPAADHKPTIQASCWEDRLAKGHAEQEGSAATGSSDGTNHTSATSTLLESTCNPVSADGAPTG